MARNTGYGKYPAEFYGREVTPRGDDHALAAAIGKEHCPFLNSRCVKIRKSQSSQTIGACSVRYGTSPHIICPHRFLDRNIIFSQTLNLLDPGDEYRIVPEITMPGGNIDYFVLSLRNDQVQDFLGVEIQALDTTGSGGIWTAREDIVARRFSPPYSYGINWKMSAKTILVQLFHKVAAFDYLGKYLVLSIQDVFLDYLEREFSMSHLRTAQTDDVFHLHTYGVKETERGLDLVVDRELSTDLKGVEMMLSQIETDEVTLENITGRIMAKMDRSREIHSFDPLIVNKEPE